MPLGLTEPEAEIDSDGNTRRRIESSFADAGAVPAASTDNQLAADGRAGPQPSSQGLRWRTGNYDWVGGSLDSHRSRCEEGRIVTLYSVTRGLLATTRTDRSGGHGDWRIDESPTLSLPHTEVYYLTSSRLAVTDTADPRHVCAAARSPDMRF